MTRGNNTNNYAEAGMRILKEIIFGRVKAYNLNYANVPVCDNNNGSILYKQAT